jgi:hypothetical protein
LHRLVENKWKIDELYNATIVGMVDAMGDTAALFDRYFIDGIIAKLTAALTSVFGTVLRSLQTGRVQVYAASMVIGVAAIGWFAFAPHADAHVDDSRLEETGKLTLVAAPGHGYKYRWHVVGDKAPEKFEGTATFPVDLRPCEEKTVSLAVQNALGRVDEQQITYCRFREEQRECCVPASQLPPPEPAAEGSGRPDSRQLMDRMRQMRQQRGAVPGGPPGAPGAPPGAPGAPPGAPADRGAQPPAPGGQR